MDKTENDITPDKELSVLTDYLKDLRSLGENGKPLTVTEAVILKEKHD